MSDASQPDDKPETPGQADGTDQTMAGYLEDRLTSLVEASERKLDQAESRKARLFRACLVGWVLFVLFILILSAYQRDIIAAVLVLLAIAAAGATIYYQRIKDWPAEVSAEVDELKWKMAQFHSLQTDESARATNALNQQAKDARYFGQRQRLVRRLGSATFWMYVALVSTLALVTFALVLLFFHPDWVTEGGASSDMAPLSIGAGVYAALALMWFLSRRFRVRQLSDELQNLDIELELNQYATSPEEEKAEKLFRLNQSQLQKYYGTNLTQTRFIFVLGIFCIAVGVAITFYIIATIKGEATPGDSKLWIALVGVANAVMVNVVGAIFLAMHAKNAEQFGAFHERLVASNEVFLSNLLTARITDTKKRQALITELAKSFAKAG